MTILGQIHHNVYHFVRNVLYEDKGFLYTPKARGRRLHLISSVRLLRPYASTNTPNSVTEQWCRRMHLGMFYNHSVGNIQYIGCVWEIQHTISSNMYSKTGNTISQMLRYIYLNCKCQGRSHHGSRAGTPPSAECW